MRTASVVRTFCLGGLDDEKTTVCIFSSCDHGKLQHLREEVYLGEGKPLIPDENGNFTNPRNMRNRFYRILDAIGMEHKGLHTFRHTFATRLINGVKQPDGSVKSLSVKQVAELLGHTTSEITEIYYVKRDNSRLAGLTDSFNL